MRKSLYAYRIPPCSRYDIAGMESWLEDMAAQGLFLDKDGLFLGIATFLRGEPERLRFRLEATDTTGGILSPQHDPDEDAIALYRQMGWHYRGRWGQFHIYASDDPHAPEPHTDPKVHAMTIHALTRFQRSRLLGFVLYSAMMYVLYGSMLFSATAIWGVGLTATAISFLLASPAQELINLVKMSRLKKRLKKGIPMEHRTDYKKHAPRVHAGRAALWIAGIILTVSLFRFWSVSITEENRITLSDWSEPLPFLTAQEVFPQGQVHSNDLFQSNGLTHWSNWIAKDHYDYTHWCDVELPGGETVDCSMKVLYFDTRFDWFALGLARELTTQAAGTPLERRIQGEPDPAPPGNSGVRVCRCLSAAVPTGVDPLPGRHRTAPHIQSGTGSAFHPR